MRQQRLMPRRKLKSVRDLVIGKMEGFTVRQDARQEKRKRGKVDRVYREQLKFTWLEILNSK